MQSIGVQGKMVCSWNEHGKLHDAGGLLLNRSRVWDLHLVLDKYDPGGKVARYSSRHVDDEPKILLHEWGKGCQTRQPWPFQGVHYCLFVFMMCVGGIFLVNQMKKCVALFLGDFKVKVTQLCPTFCDPMDYTVDGILQARILEWVTYPFSRGSPQPRNRTRVSRISGRRFTVWATREISFQT